jgi:hypothetical protein
MTYTTELYKPTETWTQDHQDFDLWHGQNGVIVNTPALKERETYFEIERIYVVEPYLNMRHSSNIAY